ncbi:MAG: BlaI/MecI/CopY family transcriptional regulator [Lachnospiraceae bacterium]|nr:BlaI/MecI/CopY family transcriptional regulator [Lachnospiraceae bacterium]
MKRKDLSASEAQIMKILWERNEDLQTLDLQKRIVDEYGKEHKRTTLGTFVDRLIQKGYVSTYRIGRYSYIRAEVTEEEYKEMIAEKEVDAWYRGGIADFVACFVKGHGISKEDARKIQEILDDLGD